MKIFAVSDVHSYYSELQKALNEAGFDKNNPDHLLVVCGDLFDRGHEAEKLFQFINSVENKVLIRGNHDSLLEDMLERGYPELGDLYNQTDKTVRQLSYTTKGGAPLTYERKVDNIYTVVSVKLENYFQNLVNYFETEHYIFVHAFIPLQEEYDEDLEKMVEKYTPDWRNAHYKDWEKARWANGIEKAIQRLNKTGKTVVMGHWHCSELNLFLLRNFSNDLKAIEESFKDPELYLYGPKANFDIATLHDCVAIDACTPVSKKVNVYVVEDTLLPTKRYKYE